MAGKVAPAPNLSDARERERKHSQVDGSTREVLAKTHAVCVRAPERLSHFALTGSRVGRRLSSAQREVYQDEVAIQAEQWREWALARARVLGHMVGIVLCAVPLMIMIMAVVEKLSAPRGLAPRQCNGLSSDVSGVHFVLSAALSGWLAALAAFCFASTVAPRARRMIPLALLSAPLSIGLIVMAFDRAPPTTLKSKFVFALCAATLAMFTSDLMYVLMRVLTGSKALIKGLSGLAMAAVPILATVALGFTVTMYQLVDKLGLSTPVLISLNATIYPAAVCAMKQLLQRTLRHRFGEKRLDFFGLIVLATQLILSCVQLQISFSFSGAGFAVSVFVGALTELGLTLLSARSIGALDAAREKTVSSFASSKLFRTGSSLLAVVSSKSASMKDPSRTASAGSLSPSSRPLQPPASPAVLLAVQAAYAADGELFGIFSAAGVIAVSEGISTDYILKLTALLVVELLTDEISVVILASYKVWVRRVRVVLEPLAVAGVMTAIQCSAQVTFIGIYFACERDGT